MPRPLSERQRSRVSDREDGGRLEKELKNLPRCDASSRERGIEEEKEGGEGKRAT